MIIIIQKRAIDEKDGYYHSFFRYQSSWQNEKAFQLPSILCLASVFIKGVEKWGDLGRFHEWCSLCYSRVLHVFSSNYT